MNLLIDLKVATLVVASLVPVALLYVMPNITDSRSSVLAALLIFAFAYAAVVAWAIWQLFSNGGRGEALMCLSLLAAPAFALGMFQALKQIVT